MRTHAPSTRLLVDHASFDRSGPEQVVSFYLDSSLSRTNDHERCVRMTDFVRTADASLPTITP
jgi:hypothetical protein